MTDNKKAVAVSTEKTKGGHKSLNSHDYEKEDLFPVFPEGTGYRDLFEKFFFLLFGKVSDSRWLNILQEWNKACRVMTFVSSLTAFCSIFFEIDYDMDLQMRYRSKHVKFHCKNNFTMGFATYVNLAVCAYMILLVVVSALVKRRELTGETTPASVKWTAFVANVILVSCSLLGFAGSMGVDVMNSIRTIRYCNEYAYGYRVRPNCAQFRSYCSGLGPAVWTSFLACASFMAGTYIDGYCILLNRRNIETSPDEQQPSTKHQVDGYKPLLDYNV